MSKESYERKNNDKLSRFHWTKKGDIGTFMMIPVRQLNIDPEYQRAVVSVFSINTMAKNFSWLAFGNIIVMQRANGEFYVVDGQQRLEVARKRGDIESIPCLVFQSEGQAHEAKAFASINTGRIKVKATDKFRALSHALIEPEHAIDEWIKSVGLRVGSDGGQNCLEFIAIFKISWLDDERAAKQSIAVERKIIEDTAFRLNSRIHKGLFWLEKNGINTEEHVNRIRLRGGHNALLRDIKTVEIESGVKEGMRLCGVGILRTINFKLKNKIQLPRVEP